jgi:hypothetical protein
LRELELREEQSLLLDGTELHIKRRELEWEWEQIDALVPPMLPLQIVGNGKRGSKAPHCPPHGCGRGRERNIFFWIHGMMVLRESRMTVLRKSQRQLEE